MSRFLKASLIAISILNVILIAGLGALRWPGHSLPAVTKEMSFRIPARPTFVLSDASSQNVEDIQMLREAALNVAEKITLLYPKDVDAICLLGKLHLRMGNPDGAIDLWKQLIEFRSDAVEPRIDLAFFEQKRGNHEQAATRFLEALERDSQRLDIYMPFVDSLLEIGKTEDAIVWLQKLLEHDPNDAKYWSRLGQAYEQSQQFPQAIMAFEEALCMDPFSRNAAIGLLSIYRSQKKEKLVTRLTEKIEFMDKTFPQIAPEDDRTDPDLVKARDLAVFAFMTALKVFEDNKDLANAAVVMERLLELVPDDTSLRKDLVSRYIRSQSSQNVVAFLEHQCAIVPQNAEAWLALGQYAMLRRDYDRANTSLRKFIELAPDNPTGYSLLSQVLMPKGRNSNEAVEFANKAVELAPTSAQYYVLATACYHHNDLTNAKKHFTKALELNPANVEAADALDMLENQP